MVARVFAGRFSRAERARQRQSIDLDDAALTDATRSRYYLALRKLLPTIEKCNLLHELDDHVCIWIRRMWRIGEPSLTIGDALSALHFYQPWTRRRLTHSWKLFAIWRKIEIPCRAPPLTWELVVALSNYELERGHLEMACVLLVAFHCLLRTGEVLHLRASDFAMGTGSAICRLHNTKTGKRNSANEAISITHWMVLDCVRALIDIRVQQNLLEAPLWNHSSAAFTQRFRVLMARFGLEREEFRPYSLRRGGATELFQRTGSMEAALVRGRWGSGRVARIYISDALSHLPRIRMTAFTKSMVTRFS